MDVAPCARVSSPNRAWRFGRIEAEMPDAREAGPVAGCWNQLFPGRGGRFWFRFGSSSTIVLAKGERRRAGRVTPRKQGADQLVGGMATGGRD
jgi:hypothetical protein